jgi:two-component system, OmpR family, alkaline phosphatase synthesis response regulator PhoP
MAKIYFVEDDQAIGYIIEKTIDNAKYDGVGFQTGESFLEAFKDRRPDMVLLDIMLPDMSGIELIKEIRKIDKDMPIMMVSALQSEMDKVTALDAGADDYLTKPFGVLELTSRIQSKLRKRKTTVVHESGNVRLDDEKHVFMIDDREVYLTNKEFQVMALLLKNKGSVVTKETIFDVVWNTDYIGETRTLDMHIKSLRDKLRTKNASIEIKTIRGIGYQV